MSSSDLSDLSSSLTSDEDVTSGPLSKGTLEHYFTKDGSSATPKSPPVKKKRPPSPPHEYVLADNPDIAFICMFRSRFNDAFSKSLPHYGPQDIEGGVVDPIPGDQVERLLCALLGLVLNRKKDIEKGHYTRALEEAIQTHAGQWPSAWQNKNPLHGGGSFNKMTPEERLILLKALIIWSLGSSEAVQAIMKESYKRSRQDDDLNQPLSVQPWGRDGDKRRYWLIEGQDDTHFRLYRESNPTLRHKTWRSVAGDIDEVKEVAHRLGEESSLLGRRLRDRIMAAIPRFEASEEKRRRRDYRLARKAQFTRPEPGFSLYEGRTRGKRMKYTYLDDEGVSDTFSTRRSNRNSGHSTPAEPSGPTFTASGRQVRSRHGGAYGESMLSGQADSLETRSIGVMDGADEDDEEGPISRGRPRRAAQQDGLQSRPRLRKHIEGYNSLDSMDDESDAASSGGWDGGDDESDNHAEDDEAEDVDMSDAEDKNSEEEEDDVRQSLVVSLRYLKSHSSQSTEKTQKDQAISKYHCLQPSAPYIAAMSSNITQPLSTQESQHGLAVSKENNQAPSIRSDPGNHFDTNQPVVRPQNPVHDVPNPPQDASFAELPVNVTARSVPYSPDEQGRKDGIQPEHSSLPSGRLR
ncbi:hypothetical protein N7G274_008789 [Stereocaulon virgatum]|uniref:WHIM1 domain-containing protein n=1 Tax=Stereocaulon virgatum TaxID=373712 RepID=A0ABR3ZXV6_9LECA